MELRVLGALEASRADRLVPLGGRQQKLVLALLVANLNRIVSTDRLIDEIWEASPPETARKAVQSYVALLRKTINRAGEILKGRGPGYLLELEAEHVDAYRFEALVHEGRSHLASDPQEAARTLREALALWGGPPYGDLADAAPSLREEGARLDELRLGALEARFEADLRLGEDASLVPELDRAAADHPYRERLRSLLMLALYRSGRQIDALSVYQKVHRTLAADLGLQPSTELQRLEQAVLEHHSLLRSEDPLAALAASETPRPLRNPFKGLRPFDEGDAEDFFGRTDQIGRLIERLIHRDLTGRLLVVAGPSGSGKSSLIQAGLIPALRAGTVPGSQAWRIETLYPGENPLKALRNGLAGTASPEEEEDLPALSMALDEPVLVVMDQFEEVFTLNEDDRARQTLFRWIAHVVAGGASNLRLLVVVRADFLDRLLEYKELARLIQPCLELVPPLAEHEVRAVVTEPAARVGAVVDPELVAEMTSDAAARPGALPLLQYTLTDLFERRTGDRLDVEVYRAAGGISGALVRRAEDLYAGLDDRGRLAIRQTLLRMVVLTDEGEYLKRSVATAELAQLPLHRDDLEEVLQTFGHYRLLTFDRDPETAHPTVGVAHEALLREWPKLRDWIESRREELLLNRRLRTAIREWEENGRHPDYLFSGSRLTQFEAWAEKTGLALTRAERGFLAESRAQEDDRLRSARRKKMGMVASIAAAVVALGTVGTVAVTQRERALEQRELAQQQEQRAQELEATAQHLEEELQREGGTIDTSIGTIVWQHLSGDNETLPELHIFLTPSGYVSVETSIDPMTLEPMGGRYWTSPDGRQWTAGPLPIPTEADRHRIEEAAGAYWLLTQDPTTLWRSDDGETWTEVRFQEGTEASRIELYEEGESLWAATIEPGRLWRSQDGLSWEAIDTSGLETPDIEGVTWTVHPGRPATLADVTVLQWDMIGSIDWHRVLGISEADYEHIFAKWDPTVRILSVEGLDSRGLTETELARLSIEVDGNRLVLAEVASGTVVHEIVVREEGIDPPSLLEEWEFGAPEFRHQILAVIGADPVARRVAAEPWDSLLGETSLVSTKEGFIAYVLRSDPQTGTFDSELWTSADGIVWSGPDRPDFLGRGEEIDWVSVRKEGDLFLATVGDAGVFHTWMSEDGIAWDFLEPRAQFGQIARLGSAWIFFGENVERELHVSADLRTWERVDTSHIGISQSTTGPGSFGGSVVGDELFFIRTDEGNGTRDLWILTLES